MADIENTPRSSAQAQIREFRRVVSAAVGAIRSDEVRSSYSALSLEELIDKAIARLEESDDTARPSRLQRIQRVKADLEANIEAMKNTPPELFRRTDANGDVNTAPEG